MNAPRIALAGAGDRRSGLAPGSPGSPGVDVDVDVDASPDSANAPADVRAPRVANGANPSIALAPPRVVVVVVVLIARAPPRARFSTTASVDDDVDDDVTALDDARRRIARHSFIVVIAPDASTTAERRVGIESKSTRTAACAGPTGMMTRLPRSEGHDSTYMGRGRASREGRGEASSGVGGGMGSW